MHEIRAAVAGTIVEVEVDEGQMVAEEDVIVVLDAGANEIVVATEVPGVVRELYVQQGDVVAAGAMIALIDES